jgi:lipopolysaccharide/colanic/teichoic acid biosynthesis glycosyltransferase
MLRRAINVTIAAVVLIVLAVPLLLVAVGIKLTSRGPVLFRQRRIGKNGREFEILKFRTMVAETVNRSTITFGDDHRVTPIGRLLRETKIDESPQLINVLKGDMNLVGPRPELPEFVARYSGADRAIVLSVEPGITDFASIRYRNESELLASVDNPLSFYQSCLIPRKLRYARFYVRRAGVALDFYIMGLTIYSLVEDVLMKAFGRRAYQVKRIRPGALPDTIHR